MLVAQQRRLKTLERKKQKLIDGYLAGAIALEDLKPRQDQVAADILAAGELIGSLLPNMSNCGRTWIRPWNYSSAQ